MTTCGLTYFGAPAVDDGRSLGLHGRASNLPATNLAHGADWHGDEYELWVSGHLREACLFAEDVSLRRRIAAWMGESRLTLEDSVTNEGHESTPHMLLYHCNVGYPVLSEHSELLIDDAEVFARDDRYAPGLPLKDPQYRPPDLGGKAATERVGDAVAARVAGAM